MQARALSAADFIFYVGGSACIPGAEQRMFPRIVSQFLRVYLYIFKKLIKQWHTIRIPPPRILEGKEKFAVVRERSVGSDKVRRIPKRADLWMHVYGIPTVHRLSAPSTLVRKDDSLHHEAAILHTTPYYVYDKRNTMRNAL